MFRVARKIRVGRETGNTHIFFGLQVNNIVKICLRYVFNGLCISTFFTFLGTGYYIERMQDVSYPGRFVGGGLKATAEPCHRA